MKRVVAVSKNSFLADKPSWYYLGKDENYDVVCTKLDRDLGYFKDKFILMIEGTAENVQLFLDYLRCSGFKIK